MTEKIPQDQTQIQPEYIHNFLVEAAEIRTKSWRLVRTIEASFLRFAQFLFEEQERHSKKSFNKKNFEEFLVTHRLNASRRESAQDPNREHLVLSEIMMATGLNKNFAKQILFHFKEKLKVDGIHSIIRDAAHEMYLQNKHRQCWPPQPSCVEKIEECHKTILECSNPFFSLAESTALRLYRISSPRYFKNCHLMAENKTAYPLVPQRNGK